MTEKCQVVAANVLVFSGNEINRCGFVKDAQCVFCEVGTSFVFAFDKCNSAKNVSNLR
jgi:hypothetical protein